MFLLDGLIICCRTKSKSGMGEAQYRLKEKINMRKVKLTDLEDTDGVCGWCLYVCVCVCVWGGGGGGRCVCAYMYLCL